MHVFSKYKKLLYIPLWLSEGMLENCFYISQSFYAYKFTVFSFNGKIKSPAYVAMGYTSMHNDELRNSLLFISLIYTFYHFLMNTQLHTKL